MMSVIKTTKSKVKFWFLKNYLSPSFKVSIYNLCLFSLLGTGYMSCRACPGSEFVVAKFMEKVGAK